MVVKEGKRVYRVRLSNKNWTWLQKLGVASRVIDEIVSIYRLGELTRIGLLEGWEEVIRGYERQNQELKECLKECEVGNQDLQKCLEKTRRENEQLRDDIRYLKLDLKLQKQIYKIENLARRFEK